MKQVIKAELYYLLKSNKIWIYIGIYIVCTVLNCFMSGDPNLSLALFVIVTLLVSELMHKDDNKTTLKNIAGCGVSYKEIFRAKCLVALSICVIMLVTSSLSSLVYHMFINTNVEGYTYSGALMQFLTKSANYLIVLIVGEFTSSIAGTIIVSILITGALPLFLELMGMVDNAMGRLCTTVYPYTLDGLSLDPLQTAIPKYLIIVAVVVILLFLCEKHYIKKYFS